MQTITDTGRQLMNTSAANYEEYWTQTFGDRFFDMATFVRLGTAVEIGLRWYYQEVSGKAPTNQQVFQRLIKPQALITLIKTDCNYDLLTNPHFTAMQEVMVHRHLFAHRSGIIDQRYIDDLKAITKEDITAQVAAMGYPDDDVYWFKPLKRLSPGGSDAGLIEDAGAFFRNLP